MSLRKIPTQTIDTTGPSQANKVDTFLSFISSIWARASVQSTEPQPGTSSAENCSLRKFDGAAD